jgi:hypothetical protein
VPVPIKNSLEKIQMNPFNPRIILYINGRAVGLQPTYEREAERVIDIWQSYKLSISTSEDDEAEKSSANRFLEIEHDKGSLHVDLNAVDAIYVKHS